MWNVYNTNKKPLEHPLQFQYAENLEREKIHMGLSKFYDIISPVTGYSNSKELKKLLIGYGNVRSWIAWMDLT